MSTEIQFRIWSNEHNQWWKPFELGYTSDMQEAGIYSKESAQRIVAQASLGGHYRRESFLIPHETMVPVEVPEVVSEKNAKTKEQIRKELTELRDWYQRMENRLTGNDADHAIQLAMIYFMVRSQLTDILEGIFQSPPK